MCRNLSEIILIRGSGAKKCVFNLRPQVDYKLYLISFSPPQLRLPEGKAVHGGGELRQNHQ